MTARVLVVDDVLPNVRLLEAKLTSEYFDVLTATSGAEALDIIQRERPDIVLLDVMMPIMNGFEVCERIKADPETAHIPVVMVTALDQQSDRLKGIQAGADDFLTKPVQDIALFARVRSLVRLKVMLDELRNRQATELSLGASGEEDSIELHPSDTLILIIDEEETAIDRLEANLSDIAQLTRSIGGDRIADRAREKNYDLVIVSLQMANTDGLRICSQLRSYEETRQVPVLVLVDEADTRMLVRALEMGVNDYLVSPPDPHELRARVITQLKRKKVADKFRENLHLNMRLAITDAVTNLYNRHYMTSHLATLVETAQTTGKGLTIAMLDIDHFKSINDTYGHAAGDTVLGEFAKRIARNVRGVDLAARYGGEEFVVVMPETSMEDAHHIAERLRCSISDEPFEVAGGEKLNVTVSIGLARFSEDANTPAEILERADNALYEAKNDGRNRTVIAAD